MHKMVVRWVGLVALAGAALYTASEFIEIAGGGISDASMAPLIAGAALLSVGIWGLHAVQAPRGGWPSLAGAALISAAFAVEAVVDTIGWGASDVAEIGARTGPLLTIFGVLLFLGGATFGVSVLRAGVYWRLAGAALIAMPALFVLVFLLGLPDLFTSLGKIVLGAALLAMSWRAWSGRTRGGADRREGAA